MRSSIMKKEEESRGEDRSGTEMGSEVFSSPNSDTIAQTLFIYPRHSL